MQDLSEKLQKVFVKTKKGQKEFIVFKKTLYPFKILKGESYPIFDFITKPKNIFDIGANIGAASFFFAEHYPESKIYAFEPSSTILPILRKNLNKYKNVSIINKAAKDVTKKNSKLFIDSHNYDGSSLYTEYMYSNDLHINNFEIVETVNIADFCLQKKIKQIDILKIDAEGSEYDIIHSLNNSLFEISVIYCESHNPQNHIRINAFLEKTHKIVKDYQKNSKLFETVYVRKNYYE